MARVMFLRKKNRGKKTSKKGAQIAKAARHDVAKRRAKTNGQRQGGERYVDPRYAR